VGLKQRRPIKTAHWATLKKIMRLLGRFFTKSAKARSKFPRFSKPGVANPQTKNIFQFSFTLGVFH
jgi:hypothetical protein